MRTARHLRRPGGRQQTRCGASRLTQSGRVGAGEEGQHLAQDASRLMSSGSGRVRIWQRLRQASSGPHLPGFGEPIAGANVLRFISTHRDACGKVPQVSGSPLDFLRPGQTPDSCLGIKGSPVQIRPSRLVTKLFRI
jgi:hypothetical protein